MMYRRGPGLLGAAARTAVVVGTAGAVSHRQQARYAARQAQQQPEQPAQQSETTEGSTSTGSDVVAQIEKLADLKSQGLLTDEEYAAAKVKLLGS